MRSFRSGVLFSFDGIAVPIATDHTGSRKIKLSLDLGRTSMKNGHKRISYVASPLTAARLANWEVVS